MEIKLKYSFDDEPVSKFCFDLDNKKIEIYFRGYYDLIKNMYMETPCLFILEDWGYAKSKVGDEHKSHDLNENIGVFNLILYMKYNDQKELELLVNTLDNRYLTLFFEDPTLSLR